MEDKRPTIKCISQDVFSLGAGLRPGDVVKIISQMPTPPWESNETRDKRNKVDAIERVGFDLVLHAH
jgi:hypothetical protein